MLQKSIFRQYDIRGIYPDTLDEEGAEEIGKALGTYLVDKGSSKVVVGRDNRISSPTLSKHFIDGLLATGCSVTNIGLAITPLIHFLTCTQDFTAGVMITASHNPKNYNGFRLDYKNAAPLYGEDIEEIHEIIKNETYEYSKGLYFEQDLVHHYIEYLKKRFTFSKRHKIVLDCGNGASSPIAPVVFEALGCEVVSLYCDLDSDFPHGIPDPENPLFMDVLESAVKENNADAGFAFDTDVDRFGLVDNTGSSYEADKLLLLYAQHALSKKPGGTVVFDVKATGVLSKIINSLGGVPKMIRTGHPYFSEEIARGALLGGEYSGHIFFGGEYFGFDDGIYAACKVLEIMDSSSKKIFELMSVFPKMYHSSEIKISCPDEIKYGLIDTVVANLSQVHDVLSVISVDGVRVQVTDTGWYLIRPSNTTPRLSVRVEGVDEAEVNLMLGRVRAELSNFEILDLTPLNSAEIYQS